MKVLTRSLISLSLLLSFGINTAQAGPIQSATDGTGTRVTSPSGNPNQFNIDGGTQAGANLFHSFQKFGLNQGQIANFLSNPSIRNILGRVVGGDVSRINGLIQVMGGRSNLYLMNPAGFIFGPNASLNVPASFTATTANGIQIGDYWFDALGRNDYSKLVGEPNAFAFVTDQPGGIVNSGHLAVPQGESITLLGGWVINTGTLTAPGGTITVASVPGKQMVKLSQEGSLLSLALPQAVQEQLMPGNEGFTAMALPELLTGEGVDAATGVVADNGVVRLTGSETEIPTGPGTTFASGTLNVSGIQGGTVNVLGNKVGVLSAKINTSGIHGDGTVLIGDYKDQGTVPNPLQTLVDVKSVISTNTFESGSSSGSSSSSSNGSSSSGSVSIGSSSSSSGSVSIGSGLGNGIPSDIENIQSLASVIDADTKNTQQLSTEAIVIEEESVQNASGAPVGGASLEEEQEIASNYCTPVNENLVQCFQVGQILTYQFKPQIDAERNPILEITPDQLPELLTGRDELVFKLDQNKPTTFAWQLPTDAEENPFKLTFEHSTFNPGQ